MAGAWGLGGSAGRHQESVAFQQISDLFLVSEVPLMHFQPKMLGIAR